MCGRYALGLRPHEVRNALQNEGMYVDEGPEDDDYDAPKPNYNLAPGNHGLVYLAHKHESNFESTSQRSDSFEAQKLVNQCDIQYKLQTMSWGLIPHWTKQVPDYSLLLKTINCRDDSLIGNKPIWNSIKCTKRCVIIAQGFFEWQKNPQKIPHYIHRKDGKLLCLAGLYDRIKLNDNKGYHFTYTIITTDSNEQLKFLHHRMPVILENGSNEIRTWLDPYRSSWCAELQNLLKPSVTKLEVYPVSKDVGKLVNNSPKLILPVASCRNNSNIAVFFSKGISKHSIDQVPSKLQIKSSNILAKSPEQIKSLKPKETVDLEISFHKKTENEEPLAASKENGVMSRKRKLCHIIDDEDQKIFARKTSGSSKRFSSILSLDAKNFNNHEIKSAHKSRNKNKSNQKITDFFVM